MKLPQLLGHYVSPRILLGPYASPASQPALQALRDDADYQELRRRLTRAGVFERAPLAYAARFVGWFAVYVALFGYLLSAPSWPARLAACVLLGLAHTHCNFLGHDISHGAAVPGRLGANLAGQIFNTLLTGFSFSYFRRSHTLHHYHCNEQGHDPDTMSVMWSVSPYEAAGKRGLGRLTTRLQHVVIPVMYTFWAFALKSEGIKYCLRNPRAACADLAVLVAHVALWFGLSVHYLSLGAALLNYAVMTAVVGVYLGLIFPVNHVGMAIVSSDEATARGFLAHQLMTTRNVTGSRLRDFAFMGLNAQIEHHLFPWIPSMRLGAARPIVRAFCAERGLPYHESSHRGAHVDVLRHLRGIARSGAANQVDAGSVHSTDDAKAHSVASA